MSPRSDQVWCSVLKVLWRKKNKCFKNRPDNIHLLPRVSLGVLSHNSSCPHHKASSPSSLQSIREKSVEPPPPLRRMVAASREREHGTVCVVAAVVFVFLCVGGFAWQKHTLLIMFSCQTHNHMVIGAGAEDCGSAANDNDCVVISIIVTIISCSATSCCSDTHNYTTYKHWPKPRWPPCLHFLSRYKAEVSWYKLPSCFGDIVWSQRRTT